MHAQVKQLDAPVHQMRSAILHAAGYIVSHIHTQLDPNSTNANANGTGGGGSGGGKGNSDTEDGGEINTASCTRLRDDLLDILTERAHDTNPYTRSTVLKIWSRLADSQSLPVRRAGSAAEIALDRLSDKNFMVRRNAIVLMT
ncbi:hypothetical protein B484DRAFT_412085, partial [Ochromonadaceae sp. CCMP2298]